MNAINNPLRREDSYAQTPLPNRVPLPEPATAMPSDRRPMDFLRFVIVNVAFAVAVLSSLMLIPARAATSSVVIKMGDKPPMFDPATVTIKVGETVEWLNAGGVVHSVTADPDDATDAHDVSLPKGATTFDSGFMPPGTMFDHTFMVPGTYHYVCIPHEKAGMVGTIVVTK
jgi:plastocyanin